eukprot:Phypoly_transcript_10670.p1 GENE.Phypoly_transcript_10670~~Phypoly_transcript_10670.p1  ORF type:complete len:322 (+),score=30.22 Phypoly_transcript_10670:192-1157(+)
MPINTTFNNVVSYIVDVFLVLSMLGCIATIVTFITIKALRTQPIKLVIYLCASIFFAQFFFFLTFYIYDSMMCIPSAMIFHYFFLSDFIWTFSVAFNFYQMIVRRNRDSENLEIFYHSAAWGIPMIVVVIMAGTQSYYNQGGYCYMAPGIPIFLAFFLPGMLVVTANTVIFVFTVKEIHDTLKSAPNTDKQEKSRELKVYFSIFASIGLSWLFGFFMVFIYNDILEQIFFVLFSIMTPLQGFLIFVSYCCNDKVWNHWKGVFGYQRVLDPTSSTASTTGRASTSTTSANRSRQRGASPLNRTQDDSISLSADASGYSGTEV